MRKLSNDEKNFLSELIRISVNSHNVFLANIIDRELNNIDIFVDYANNLVEYRIDQNMYNNDPTTFMQFTREFSWKIMRYVQLLKDLEKAGMLFLYQESPNTNSSRFGRLVRNNQYIQSSINDSDAIQSIIKYAKKTIIINESLIEYVRNNFQTNDEVRYSEEKLVSAKNLKTAKNSLIVTIVALSLTIITSLVQIFHTEESSKNSNEKEINKLLKYIHYDVHKK